MDPYDLYDLLFSRLETSSSIDKKRLRNPESARRAGEICVALTILHAIYLDSDLPSPDAELQQLLAVEPELADDFIENWDDPPQYVRDAYVKAFGELPDWLIEEDKKRAAERDA